MDLHNRLFQQDGIGSNEGSFEGKPSVIDRSINWRRVEASQHQAYDVFLTANSQRVCCELLKKLLENRQRLIVTSPTVAQLYGNTFSERILPDKAQEHVLVLDCNESTKNIDQVLRVCQQAHKIGLDRQGILVAIGGGVCMDIVTIAASWLYRGIDYIRVPTTLIGQVDAAISIKGAVNFNGKKSYLGCFHPPKAAVITPLFLRTLPRKYIRAGLAEILKMAIIRDQHLFSLVETNHHTLVASGFESSEDVAREVLWRSITAMLSELEPNIYEDQTCQRKVDFGHTVSPTLEAACRFNLTHGETVAIDMALSSVLASHMELLSWETCMKILSLFLNIGLPIWLPALSLELCQTALHDVTLRRRGMLNLVVPTAIGETKFIARIEDLPERLLRTALCHLKKVSETFTQPPRISL